MPRAKEIFPRATGSSALVYTPHAHFQLWIYENYGLLWINVAENRHFLDNFSRSPIPNFNKLCKVDTMYIGKIILALFNQNMLLINTCPLIGPAPPLPPLHICWKPRKSKLQISSASVYWKPRKLQFQTRKLGVTIRRKIRISR